MFRIDDKSNNDNTKDLSVDELERFTFEIVQWSDYIRTFRVVDGRLCGIERFLFTWGVLYGIEQYMYQGRFCFDTQLNAEGFLQEWDGITHPIIGEDGCTAIK